MVQSRRRTVTFVNNVRFFVALLLRMTVIVIPDGVRNLRADQVRLKPGHVPYQGCMKDPLKN